ncbi:MAG: hypothetical protein NC388_00980 [Clostridium sp.]|nr:hypothetical protein [Clostridium sp.]
MNLPEEFTTSTRALLGEPLFQILEEALGEEAPVSVRLNGRKCRLAGLSDEPSVLADADGVVPWCASAVYLSKRPAFTFDPFFHAGLYYVQEAGSMFLEQALRRYVTSPVLALDLCAAPGGKSTHARSLLPEGSLLVSNEPIRGRAQVLAENIIKWGHPDCIVTQNYPQDFTPLRSLFDLIIVDAPCSGEGMFRKDAGAVEEWSPVNVELCRMRQREILEAVWPALRPGGIIIYSTCTYNIKENEENVAWAATELGATVLPIDVPEEWGVTGNLMSDSPVEERAACSVYRFLPGRTRGEGFFLAVLRKNDESIGGDADGSRGTDDGETCMAEGCVSGENRGGGSGRGGKNSRGGKAGRGGKVASPAWPRECLAWVNDVDRYEFLAEAGGRLTAVPKEYAAVYRRLRERLTVLHAFVPVAELKGRDWMPAHALSMSIVRAEGAFPAVEITWEQAVAYLRREAIVLRADAPRGCVLLTHRGVLLGFVKNLGSRANNLYPAEWRIRSGYVSEVHLIE